MKILWDIVCGKSNICIFECIESVWINNGVIIKIEATHELGVVEIYTANGKKKYALESLNTENKLFWGVTKSRSKFLEKWRNIKDSVVSKQEQAESLESNKYSDDEETETEIAELNLPIHKEVTSGKRHCTKIEKGICEIPGFSITCDSMDRTVGLSIEEHIQKKLKGQALKVSIHNMVAPPPNRRLREIDFKHVKELKESFLKRPQTNILFCGNISRATPINVEDLSKQGGVEIETIGGNHSRIAIQELLMEKKITNDIVFVNVYCGLSDIQALRLGYDHNVINDLGRPTSAEDLMRLFRYEYVKDGQTKEKVWKESLASILGITKTKLHNVYHPMLPLAKCCEREWLLLTKFMKAWREEKILKKPKGELKKLHFTKISMVKKGEERISVLNQLILKDIDWKMLCDTCEENSKKTRNTKLSEKDVISAKGTDECNSFEKEENKVKELEKEDSKEETSGQNLEKKDDEEAKLKQMSSVEKDLISEKELHILKLEKNIKELEDVLEKQIQESNDLKRKCEEREENIVHLTNTNRSQQSSLDSYISEIKRLKAYGAQLEENYQEILQENKVLKEKLLAANEEKKRPSESSENISNNPIKKIKATEKEAVKEKLGVVEYTRDTVYIGKINNENFTFAKTPMGKLHNFRISEATKDSFILRPKDVIKYQKEFLIFSFFGKINDLQILLSEEQKNSIQLAVSNYSKTRI